MKPTIGRIVHYVLSKHDGVHDGAFPSYRCAEGEIVSAIVTAVWSDTCVNLQVILDGSNHGYDQRRHPDRPGGFENVPATMRWVTSAGYSEWHQPRTWHWPPREPQDNRVQPRNFPDERQAWDAEARDRGEIRRPDPIIIAPVPLAKLPEREYTFPGVSTSGPVSTENAGHEGMVVKVPTPAGDKLVMASQANEVLAIERQVAADSQAKAESEAMEEANGKTNSGPTESTPEVGLRGTE